MSLKPQLIVTEGGTPFSSQEAAIEELKKRNLDETYRVVKHLGGWAIRSGEGPVPVVARVQPKENPADVFGYWVIFQQRTNNNQPKQVPLSVDGKVLQISRGVQVPLPMSYLGVADHAVYHDWEQVPGYDRQIVAPIARFPYTKIRPCTKAEYTMFLTEGNKIREEEDRRRSMDAAAKAATGTEPIIVG